MSNIQTSHNSFTNTLIKIDKISNYVPILSSITNLVNILEKCILSLCFKPSSIENNHYFSYINDKSKRRCFILLVPFFGNIVVGVYDLVKHQKAKNIEREKLNKEATKLALKISLPREIPVAKKIVNDKRQQRLQAQTLNHIQNFSELTNSMRTSVEKFKKVVDNPEEPLEPVFSFGKSTIESHSKKIDHCWLILRAKFDYQGVGNSLLDLPENNNHHNLDREAINKEISDLKTESIKLRQISYHKYVQTLGRDGLLKEAQKYYLNSFLRREQKDLQGSIEEMSLETILPKLKERIINLAEKDYMIIEMQEIISRLENN